MTRAVQDVSNIALIQDRHIGTSSSFSQADETQASPIHFSPHHGSVYPIPRRGRTARSCERDFVKSMTACVRSILPKRHKSPNIHEDASKKQRLEDFNCPPASDLACFLPRLRASVGRLCYLDVLFPVISLPREEERPGCTKYRF